MEPTNEHLSLALTVDQIERIAVGVIEQHGPNLTRTQFNDAALGVFESVPGLETLPGRQVSRLLAAMWKVYFRMAIVHSIWGAGTVTLVATLEIHRTPVIIGDLMITRGKEHLTRKKIMRIRPNLAVGWSDRQIEATVMLRKLDENLPHIVTLSDVCKALRSSAVSAGGTTFFPF